MPLMEKVFAALTGTESLAPLNTFPPYETKLLSEEMVQVAPRDPFNSNSWHLISLPGDANTNVLTVHQECHRAAALESELCAINHLGHGPQICLQINKGPARALEMGQQWEG